MIYHKVLVTTMLLLFLFVLISHCVEYDSLFVSGELRCKAKEREALLKFKQGLADEDDILSSWGSEEDKNECCKWKGIKCSNKTRHVISLQLSCIDCHTPLRGKISSALLELSYLTHLDLSWNDFGYDEIPQFIGSLQRLQYLNLKYSGFSGVVPYQLGNLTNLRTLYLGLNNLVLKNLNFFSHLSSLSILDLSWLEFSYTDLLEDIFKLPSLTELHLSDCNIPTYFFVNSSSTTLSILDLSNNGLTSSSFHWLLNMSTNLRSIDLSDNYLSVIPDAFGRFTLLEFIDLSDNRISGGIPKFFWNFRHLQALILSGNHLSEPLSGFKSFEGTVSDADLSKLQKLKVLDLSYNSLVLNFTIDWIPPFQLDTIGLACCKMGPHFPAWLQTQTNFSILDLSCAGISDEVPKWLWDLSPRMSYLNLSHNQISGTIPGLSSNFVGRPIVDISHNNFSGHLPLFHPYSWIVQLNNNLFMGSISSICTITFDWLMVLDLSNNQLFGELPNCWDNMTRLQILNLDNNNLFGHIPHSLGSLSSLLTLHLRDNNFSLGLPSALKKCKNLFMIDVGGNKLTGNIPSWIGTHLTALEFLILGHNNFYGGIPQEICYLTEIQVLDLSRNSISGTIPQCFNNFTYLVEKNKISDSYIFSFSFTWYRSYPHEFIEDALVQWKGQESQYRRTLGLLKLIDLSSNRLVGIIPREFSHLKALISLNLSTNYLSGNIISNIGEMEMLECLDLSRNQFSDEIPSGLAELHFLGVLDLSNNNLSGKIPSSTQLQSFNASAYAANSELCGPPLQSCPEDVPKPSVVGYAKLDETDDGIITHGFFISMVFGFILGFWGVVGTLVIKNSWRHAYFNFFNEMKDWLYVTTTIYAVRLRGSLRATART